MMQHLIQVLRNGYSYNHTKQDGNTEHTLVPPNRYMIQAAREIEKLQVYLQNTANALEKFRAANDHLVSQCEMYRATIKRLEDATGTVSDDSGDGTHKT